MSKSDLACASPITPAIETARIADVPSKRRRFIEVLQELARTDSLGPVLFAAGYPSELRHCAVTLRGNQHQRSHPVGISCGSRCARTPKRTNSMNVSGSPRSG